MQKVTYDNSPKCYLTFSPSDLARVQSRATIFVFDALGYSRERPSNERGQRVIIASISGFFSLVARLTEASEFAANGEGF